MQGPSILKIKEIFWSFQGEGLRMGTASVFLRMAGCALQCPDCDTKYSWENNDGELLPIEKILKQIEKYQTQYPRSQVVITGGEPLQQDLSGITAALKKKNRYLSIETNGIHHQDLPIDWWTVSPKDVTDYFIHPVVLKKINEIKLVVNKNLNISVIKRIRAMTPPAVPVFLQPGANDKNRYRNTFSLFRRCQEEKLENTRCGIQLHKVYDVL